MARTPVSRTTGNTMYHWAILAYASEQNSVICTKFMLYLKHTYNTCTYLQTRWDTYNKGTYQQVWNFLSSGLICLRKRRFCTEIVTYKHIPTNTYTYIQYIHIPTMPNLRQIMKRWLGASFFVNFARIDTGTYLHTCNTYRHTCIPAIHTHACIILTFGILFSVQQNTKYMTSFSAHAQVSCTRLLGGRHGAGQVWGCLDDPGGSYAAYACDSLVSRQSKTHEWARRPCLKLHESKTKCLFSADSEHFGRIDRGQALCHSLCGKKLGWLWVWDWWLEGVGTMGSDGLGCCEWALGPMVYGPEDCVWSVLWWLRCKAWGRNTYNTCRLNCCTYQCIHILVETCSYKHILIHT